MSTQMQTYTSVTGQNQLSSEQAEFYQRALLSRLQDKVVFLPYGKTASIPKNSGATTSWRRLEMPTLSTSAITEGVTPDGSNITINKVSATVSQYGAWCKISDHLDTTGLDPLLTEVAEMFGEHAALSMDKIVATILGGGSNINYANGRASRATLATGDVLKAADIAKARNSLVSRNVPTIKLPNGKMGYVAFIHPDNATRLMTESGGPWSSFNAGGTQSGYDNFAAGEAGQMYGIYFIETTLVPSFSDAGSGGSLSGKGTIIIGADAFGIPDVGGNNQPEILVYGDGNTENPMALYRTVAWKTSFAAVRLEENRILRIESLDA